MTKRLPLFPLNAVFFPGVTTGLHVFEDRYQALVADLQRIPEPRDQVFGITAIREGFEVGDHGVQSLHVVGTLVQLTGIETYPDGRSDIEVVGRDRFRITEIDPSGDYAVGVVEDLPSSVGSDADRAAQQAMATFMDYRIELTGMRGVDVHDDALPHDPVHLSWQLAGSVLLNLHERQQLLEIDAADERLIELRRMMLQELAAMQVVPSLPATELSRTRWSPN